MDEVLIRFRLIGDEAHALCALSSQELRHPRDQTRYILIRELERRGFLLTDADDQPQAQPEGETREEVRSLTK